MDEPTDPLARQLALAALTTEQFNLQSARVGTIAEANGRSALYLGTLSSTVIAIAFIGQASELGDAFYLFALTLLPPVFLLGVFTYLRLVQTSIEDMVYAVGSFRIRQYFLRLDPAAVPFFPPTDPRGVARLERMGVVTSSPLQALLTAASMVACVNAIVGGVAVALAVRALLGAAVPVAAVAGVVVTLVLAALFMVHQVRRFLRAAAVVADLYEGESPGMPGWAKRTERRGPVAPPFRGRPPSGELGSRPPAQARPAGCIVRGTYRPVRSGCTKPAGYEVSQSWRRVARGMTLG
jgi:hypothetical protein